MEVFRMDPTEQRNEALDYMTSAQTAALAVADLHRAKQRRRDEESGRTLADSELIGRRIGEAESTIATALEIANVHALLYIGDTLAAVLSELGTSEPISIPGAEEPLICRYHWCEQVAEIGSDFCEPHQ